MVQLKSRKANRALQRITHETNTNKTNTEKPAGKECNRSRTGLKSSVGYTKIGDVDITNLRNLNKKTHGNGSKLIDVYDTLLNTEYIKACINEASQDKRKRKDVQKTLANIEIAAEEIKGRLSTGEWAPPPHKTYIINEGTDKKNRSITKPIWYDEQIVHHMVINIFKSVVKPRLNANVCGSIPGRGTHMIVAKMVKIIAKYLNKKVYVAELDIRKFYDSIRHDTLKRMFRWYIKDERFLSLLDSIVDSYSSSPDDPNRGLALGNYTSPWFANFYMLQADDLILQDLPGVDHYLRYMDNIFLFSTNKRRLHAAKDILEAWLDMNLGLAIKDDWQIYRFEHEVIQKEKGGKKTKVVHGRPIDALGFVIHHNRIGVRKNIINNMRKLAEEIGDPTADTVLTYKQASSFVSRMGYALTANGRKYYNKYIKSYIKMSEAKKRVSAVSSAEKEITGIYIDALYTCFTIGKTHEQCLEEGIIERVTKTVGKGRNKRKVECYRLNPKLYDGGVKFLYDRMEKSKGQRAPCGA